MQILPDRVGRLMDIVCVQTMADTLIKIDIFEALQRHKQTLLYCLDSNSLILVMLRADGVIDELTFQEIEAEQVNHKKNVILLDRLKYVPSFEFSKFLEAL